MAAMRAEPVARICWTAALGAERSFPVRCAHGHGSWRLPEMSDGLFDLRIHVPCPRRLGSGNLAGSGISAIQFPQDMGRLSEQVRPLLLINLIRDLARIMVEIQRPYLVQEDLLLNEKVLASRHPEFPGWPLQKRSRQE